MLDGGDQRISLPRQIHTGSNVRNYVSMASASAPGRPNVARRFRR